MNQETSSTSASACCQKALVTGGGGFLGKVIVRKLVEQGVKVRSFSRGSYPELEKLGVEVVRGDIAEYSDVLKAVSGCDLVFHVASKPGMWGAYETYYRPNVTGTEHVLKACREARIDRLVYTSSPSVVFDGKDVEGANESLPYPDHYEAHYPKTKAIAEKAVLQANSPALATVSLRPHLIWGPEDQNFIPRLISRAKAGRLRFIGDGQNKVDTVYVDNAADAHLAAGRLLKPGAAIAGKAYFITNDEPRTLADFFNGLLHAAGYPPISGQVSPRTAAAVGWLLETVYHLFGWQEDPPMTRWVANEMATSHWFDISAARKDLGYVPKIRFDEGMKLLQEWLARNPLREK
jgi:nucleoside-diphosphate-sugar epimerase